MKNELYAKIKKALKAKKDKERAFILEHVDQYDTLAIVQKAIYSLQDVVDECHKKKLIEIIISGKILNMGDRIPEEFDPIVATAILDYFGILNVLSNMMEDEGEDEDLNYIAAADEDGVYVIFNGYLDEYFTLTSDCTKFMSPSKEPYSVEVTTNYVKITPNAYALELIKKELNEVSKN